MHLSCAQLKESDQKDKEVEADVDVVKDEASGSEDKATTAVELNSRG